jgi:hypothetical protein
MYLSAAESREVKGDDVDGPKTSARAMLGIAQERETCAVKMRSWPQLGRAAVDLAVSAASDGSPAHSMIYRQRAPLLVML